MYGVLAVNGIVLYVAVFQLAFRITENIEGLREMIEVTSFGLTFRGDQKYCRKVLKSIPEMAISVETFHKVERESVPAFLSYVCEQVVDLLVAF